MNIKIQDLIKEISLIKLDEYVKPENPISIPKKDECSADGISLSKLNDCSLALFSTKEGPHYIDEKEQKEITEKIKQYLDIEIIEGFFNLGNLKKKVDPFPNNSCEYFGTEKEQQKNDLISELNYLLLKLELLKMYIKTFNDCIYLPISIHNISYVLDEDISIYITVDEEESEIVVPNAKLFNSEIRGLEGIIYDSGFIKELFLMTENVDIRYAEDITYTIEDSIANVPKFAFNPYGNNGPNYTAKDYSREISKYIAKPIVENGKEFEFNIKSLRPNEKNWIGPVIMFKADADTVKIKYEIKSSKSDGNITGVFQVNLK